MTKEQILFWREISCIQDNAVAIPLIDVSKYKDKKALLNDVTSETIYRIMEMLDGYRNDSIKGKIISTDSGCTINSGIELHDCCVDFLEGID